ncbi:MAG: iron ABC transporter permease [Rikenellaceae bacterium]|nr:iron ABC transporter permease [Rikenellaceae bacterium]
MKRTPICFVFLAVLLAGLFAGDILLGSVGLSAGDIWRALAGRAAEGAEGELARSLVRSFRLPKAVVAVAAGAALSASGLQMQTLFRNPLAGPYVLGVSSGASLGVSLFLLGLPLLGASGATEAVRDLGTVGSAWVGAAAILIVVMAVSARIKDIMAVLILGMMFGSAATAFVDILQFLSPEGAVKSFVVWTMGSLGGVSADQLRILVPAVVAGLVLSVWLIKPLNLLLLGESYARTMGLRVKLVRGVIMLSTILLAGSVTAFCGPIGFIGIAVPHIARMLLGDADHRVLMPASMLLGAVVMLGCDIISQMPGSDMVLPINTISALLGIPVVVIVVVRNRKFF